MSREMEVTPLNDAAWQTWLTKGRVREQRVAVLQNQAVRWGCLAALLIAAVLGSSLAPYDGVVRFVVTVGAVAFMLRMLRRRQSAFAAGFGLLAIVYNPLLPMFRFDGTWQRAFLVASALPFMAPFVWRTVKEPCHA